MNARVPRLGAMPETGDHAADDLAQAFAQLLRDLHLQHGGDAADADAVASAARHVSRAASDEHSCVDLRDAAMAADNTGADAAMLSYQPVSTPDAWLARVARSPVVAQVAQSEGGKTSPAAADQFRPLVLDHRSLLYLHRYWAYERRLAAALIALDCAAPLGCDEDRERLLEQLFGDRATIAGAMDLVERASALAGLERQRSAAAVALVRRLCVISGGPGTGKTTTVVRILAMLLSLAPDLRIALAAPTGKAAARMQESIRRQLDDLPVASAIKARLPGEAFTLHRLLGYWPGKAQFRHDHEHPLGYDVVIVDEASMLDLALAAKLLDALPGHGRLVLLGDKDQLASVETGAVFAEICAARGSAGASRDRPNEAIASRVARGDASAEGRGVSSAVITLEHSYRFSAGSGIGRLARYVNVGDGDAALAYLATAPADLMWQPVVPKAARLAPDLIEGYMAFVDAVRGQAAPIAILAAFEHYRVLCAVRQGEQGALEINAQIEERFRVALGQSGAHRAASAWFAGRPILVTRNDYIVKVFNGDVGVALPTPTGELLVHFPTSDGGTRTVAPSRLSECETAFAMTIHKAQGSEFYRVDVVLPERDNRVLTRELIYTALTRARLQVRLWAPADILKTSIERRTRRYSGLALRLENAGSQREQTKRLGQECCAHRG